MNNAVYMFAQLEMYEIVVGGARGVGRRRH